LNPNCYNCHHRQPIPGDTHSCCEHPDVKSDLLSELAAILRIGESEIYNPVSAAKLGIAALKQGIEGGWFNWPVNFDPTWLTDCNGYDPIEIPWWENARE